MTLYPPYPKQDNYIYLNIVASVIVLALGLVAMWGRPCGATVARTILLIARRSDFRAHPIDNTPKYVYCLTRGELRCHSPIYNVPVSFLSFGDLLFCFLMIYYQIVDFDAIVLGCTEEYLRSDSKGEG